MLFKYAIKSMIQTIISQIKKYLDHTARSSKPNELAAIHATVLSIMIGIFSAYFFFINSEIRTKQLYAMSKAEEINNVQFNRYDYMPDSKDMVMASGPKDMEALGNLILELVILTSSEKGGTNVGTFVGKVNIPNDPAERAERIVGIINIIVHRYPFPKAIDRRSGGVSTFRPEPIIFTDFENLGQWLKDLEKVINFLKPVTTFMPLFYSKHVDSYLRALAVREKDNIAKSQENLSKQIMGERNPYKIVNEFINSMSIVENVLNTTRTELNRANELQTNLASKPFLFVVLVSGFIIFVIGVVLPLSSFSLSPILYIHLPLVYYIVIYIMIILKVTIY